MKESQQPTGVSLNICAERLRAADALGDQAPAHITLKRWSADGKLASAVIRHGKRKLYDPQQVLRIAVQAQKGRVTHEGAGSQVAVTALPSSSPDSSASQPRNEGVPADRVLLDRIALGIEGLRDEFMNRLASIENGLSNLEATRRLLMTKYDAEATLLRGRVASLERDASAAQGSTPSVDVAKLNMLLSRVSDQLGR